MASLGPDGEYELRNSIKLNRLYHRKKPKQDRPLTVVLIRLILESSMRVTASESRKLSGRKYKGELW
jgi:hypothetical protein